MWPVARMCRGYRDGDPQRRSRDAADTCGGIRRSISELCSADHHNDPVDPRKDARVMAAPGGLHIPPANRRAKIAWGGLGRLAGVRWLGLTSWVPGCSLWDHNENENARCFPSIRLG